MMTPSNATMHPSVVATSSPLVPKAEGESPWNGLEPSPTVGCENTTFVGWGPTPPPLTPPPLPPPPLLPPPALVVAVAVAPTVAVVLAVGLVGVSVGLLVGTLLASGAILCETAAETLGTVPISSNSARKSAAHASNAMRIALLYPGCRSRCRAAMLRPPAVSCCDLSSLLHATACAMSRSVYRRAARLSTEQDSQRTRRRLTDTHKDL